MYHTSYLIHYNKNHSKANGQFTSGDGDGDGIANDHANQRKSQSGGKSGGYSKTSGYKTGATRLKKGFREAAAGDVFSMSMYALSSSLSNYSAEAAAGAKFIGTAAGTALNIKGIVDIAKGGSQMAKSARSYNAGK